MVNNWSRLQWENYQQILIADMSVTPDLQAVYSKWENKGPRQRQPDTSTQKILQDGRQKWRDRYGDQIKPQNRRSSYKQKAIPTENVSYNVITQFKTMPTITADSFITSRPLMGHCCSCVPYSQKDFSTSTQNHGINNILNVTDGVRPKGFFDRRLKKLAYTFRRNTSHRYNDILMLVLTAPRVSEAVKMKSEKVTSIKRKEKIEKNPAEILKVMKAAISNKLLKITAWLLLKFLSVMLNGVHVHKNQMVVIKKASERGIPMIYLPLHLSHLDYILVTFILWNYDIKAPFVAAGDNLNIPVFNLILRGLGGFFIRRKLDKVAGQKDTIYRAVLHTYMQEILKSGEDLEFFIEGGRTRSGRAYHPKGGLLSVVMDTLNDGLIEDAYMVPISINYEKILDGNYCNEEMGLPKKRETFWGVVKGVVKVLSGNYGSVRVDFSHPFSLKEYIQRNASTSMMSDDDLPDTPSPTGIGNAADTPLPMDTSNAGDVPSPTNISKAGSCSSLYGTDIVIEDQRQSIEGVAEHVLYYSVQSQSLMCTNLVAFLLLTKYREGTTVKQLIRDIDWLKGELRFRKRDVGFVGETSEVLEYAMELLTENLVIKVGDNNIKPCTELPQIFELSYYANPVLSVFLLESVLACSVIFHCDIDMSSVTKQKKDVTANREDILTTAQSLCKLLKYDFIFCPPCKRLEEELADALDELVTSEILRVQEDDTGCGDQHQKWARSLSATVSWDDDEDNEAISEQMLKVNVHRSDCFNKLLFLYKVLAPILESYYLTALHISRDLAVELPEDSFIHILHTHAKKRVEKKLASFAESAALSTIKNAVKGFEDSNIVNVYYAGNVRMMELRDHYTVWNKLNYYLDLLESLRN
ncbi:glycerol-3-phosphate acyltransferase 1, mitochondrial-like isoform X2 [Mytilus edulis]|uniref:glycerol-3-phosphate acyltransferase 1, mitochondrial-like isoform X2 n=1 Tax=Mytilus edulis TaxID=6550 RepID=UPI0039EFCB96